MRNKKLVRNRIPSLSSVLVLLLIFGSLGFLFFADLQSIAKRYGIEETAPDTCVPVAHGSGVYTFGCGADEIGRALGVFKEANPTLRITSMVQANHCVLCRERNRQYLIITE